MSVNKCTYSIQFKPLVQFKRAQLANDPDKFIEWTKDNFINAQQARVLSDDGTSSFTTKLNLIAHNLNEAPEKVDSIKVYYANNSSGYNNCITSFKRNIVEASLFNKNASEQDRWIDANTINEKTGLNLLNEHIVNYKVELINKIRGAFGKSSWTVDFNDPNADATLSLMINDAIRLVDENSNITSDDFAQVYQAYVILKNFNKLLAEKAPFISIKSEYENSTLHGLNMYKYEGPNVKLRVSWTTNEHVSAQSQYSDLSTILLDYFPEVSENTDLIRTIGTSGFIGVMTRFKTALFYSRELQTHRNNYYHDLNNPTGERLFNISEALSDYLQMLKERTGKWRSIPESVSTQFHKIEGIIKYLFNKESVPVDVAQMFYAMFDKTEPLSYMEYVYKNGKFGKNNLKDEFVKQQQTELQKIINGRVHTFRNNPKLFRKFKKEYGIKISQDSITVQLDESNSFTLSPSISRSGHFTVTVSGWNYSSMDLLLSNFIVDLLGTFLPLDEEYIENSLLLGRHVGGESVLLEDFKEIIAMTLLGSSDDVRFAPYDNVKKTLNFRKNYLFSTLNQAAVVLNTVYGNESRNVVNNIRGDKIPTNGLTSLVHNAHKLAADMVYSFADSPYRLAAENSILAPKLGDDGNYTMPGFLGPIVRSGVDINGKTKDVTALTLPELLEIAITYDYLDSLNDETDTIYLQHANEADKSRHWIIPFLLKKVDVKDRFLDPKTNEVLESVETYDIPTMLRNLAKGQSAPKIYEAIRLIRKLRYNNIVENVLHDYNEAFGLQFNTFEKLDEWLESENMSVDEIQAVFRMDSDYLLSLKYQDGTNKYDEIKLSEMFAHRKGKINFKSEVHASNLNDVGRVNETLKHYWETFNSPKLFERRMAKSRAYFAKDIFDSRLKLNKNRNQAVADKWGTISDDWKEKIKVKDGTVETGNLILFKVFDKSGKLLSINATNVDQLLNPENKIVLNPILESYMVADILYTNEYNMLLTGDVFGHPIKRKSGKTTDNGWGSSDFYDYCEASRLVAMNKRAVIYGSSIHSFQHDLANNRGTAKKIKCAVIKDPKIDVYTMIGGLDNKRIDDDVDVYDGSGLQNIYQAILEQESLIDAAAGMDEKTILGYNDKYFGGQKLLKWAVYAITNERRRMSKNSDVSLENLFKRMNNQTFDVQFDLYNIFNNFADNNNLYIRNSDSRKYYKVLGVVMKQNSRGENVYAREAIEVNKEGIPINENTIVYLDNRNNAVYDVAEEFNTGFTYNTIYDLDQFFGGAYEMELKDGKLQYSNRGNHAVADIICDYDLKNHMISYVVNASAMKAGAENVNQETAYYDDSELDTMEMSTEYGGLQMNAEHELDDSEIKEMTQMISALIEKGWSSNLVNAIYNDIGYVVEEALKKFKTPLDNNDSLKLRTIFGKALIQAYAKGDRDTLGLAQAFLANAEKMLRENDIEFKFPFSGATIHGSFVSTVASLFTKSAIRRKYSGVAAVLTPSYDMITVYGNQMAESYYDDLAEWRDKNPNFENWSLNELTQLVEKDGVFNPFIVWNDNKDFYFTFEDTLVVQNEDGTWRKEKVSGYETYWKYKHQHSGPIGILTSHARNLRGSDTVWEIKKQDGSIKKYSVYDLGTTHAANLSVKQKLNSEEKEEIIKALAWARRNYDDYDRLFVSEGDLSDDLNSVILDNLLNSSDFEQLNGFINIRKSLYNIVQRQLRDLSNSNTLKDVRYLPTTVENVHVEGAEIVLGKMWASQFLLEEGDDISDILKLGSRFFASRLREKYKLPDKSLDEYYDTITWTKDGNPILVKIASDSKYELEGVTTNRDISIVDGVAYLDERELCSTNNRQFYKVNDGRTQYNVLVVNSVEDFKDFLEDADITIYKINPVSNNLIGLVEPNNDGNYVYKNNDGYDETLSEEIFNTLDDETKLYILRSIMQTKGDSGFNRRLNNLATRMFDSFKLSLNAVGARIPSQGMQSFQPMKIVGFSDSLTNDVYVNRHNTYLEGSDFDIDKTYILTYSVRADGTIETTSRLSDYLGTDMAFRLNLPKNRNFIESDSDDAQIISDDDLRVLLDNKNNVDLWNKVLSGNENIKFVRTNNYYNEDTFNKKKDLLIKLLKRHESTRITEDGLKNRVVHTIRQVVLDPKNQLNLHNPVAMTDQRNAADKQMLAKNNKNKNTDLSDDLHMNIDIPSAKYKAQVDNMIGKSCVGITAVALKSFFAKSAYTNELLQMIPYIDDAQIIDILQSISFVNPANNKLTLLANVNVGDIIDKLKELGRIELNVTSSKLSMFNNNGKFNIIRCLKYFERVSNRVDCALQLSGLLSAATDNAKELILKKINATSKLIDLYTVGLQMGVKFEEISDIMTSPLFNSIVRISENNIFKREGSYNLEKAIAFYLDSELLPLSSTNLEILKSIAKNIAPEDLLQNGIITDTGLKTLLTNNTFVNQILGEVCNLIKNLHVNLNDDGFEQDVFEDGVSQPKLDDYLRIQNLLEECLDRNDVLSGFNDSDLQEQKNKVDLIRKKFMPAAEEQTVLGVMLRINQQVPNSEYDQYRYVQQIETFVTNRLKLTTKFDLMRFLSDAEYAKNMTDAYDEVKSMTNILDVIQKVPHFAKMFKSLYDLKRTLTGLSSRYEFTQNLANEIQNSKYGLSQNEFKQIGYYVNDRLLVAFLTSRGLEFDLGAGLNRYLAGDTKPTQVSKSTKVKLENLYDLATFKNWMENYVIPALKDRYGKDNAFISRLSKIEEEDSVTGRTRSYYKLPLNMLAIDTTMSHKLLYEDCLRGFNDIARHKFSGWSIVDLFFVYNAIINKDAIGRTSMTRLFEDMVGNENNSNLVTDYYNFISDVDSNPELRQEIAGSLRGNDVKSYIRRNVRNTYIERVNDDTGSYGEDFTFLIPSLLGGWTLNKPHVDPYVSDTHENEYKLSGNDTMSVLETGLNERFGITSKIIETHSSQWFLDNAEKLGNDYSDAPAFIHSTIDSDGTVHTKIYFNVDKGNALSAIHEFTHAIFAQLKYSALKQKDDNALYYKIMTVVRKHPMYDSIAKKYKDKYGNYATGTDMDEEVFVNLLENYLNNKLSGWVTDDIFRSNTWPLISALNEVFGIGLPEDVDLINVGASNINDIIKFFGSKVLSFDDFDVSEEALNWRMETKWIKDRLLENYKHAGNNGLNYNCE